jgi:Holliday junction resolvase RusA-like endonuclease
MRDPAEYQFILPGACPPKGSRTPVRKGSDKTRESSKRVDPWTVNAVRAMRDSLGKPLASFSGPVYVGATFVFKRPKVTEFEFPTATTIGDLDKLVRCLLDAMTKAGVIEDDRFVVELPGPPRKLWGGRDRTFVRVGNVSRAMCPARLPEGDAPDCVCGNPAACGEASVTGRPLFTPPERCDCTEVRNMPPGLHYHDGNGAGICWCMRLSCLGCVPNPYA